MRPLLLQPMLIPGTAWETQAVPCHPSEARAQHPAEVAPGGPMVEAEGRGGGLLDHLLQVQELWAIWPPASEGQVP